MKSRIAKTNSARDSKTLIFHGNNSKDKKNNDIHVSAFFLGDGTES